MMGLFVDLLMCAAILAVPVVFIIANLNYQPPPRCPLVDVTRQYYNACQKERGHAGPCRTIENRYFFSQNASEKIFPLEDKNE